MVAKKVQKVFLFPFTRAQYLNIKSREAHDIALEAVANSLVFTVKVAGWHLKLNDI